MTKTANRARMVASTILAVLLAVIACGCTQCGDIPENMSTEAYDYGTEIVKIADDYLEGDISADAAEAKMDRATSSFKCKDGYEGDRRVSSMAYFVQDSFGSSTEEHIKGNLRTSRDNLEHVLETGEYPSDLNGFEGVAP